MGKVKEDTRLKNMKAKQSENRYSEPKLKIEDSEEYWV